MKIVTCTCDEARCSMLGLITLSTLSPLMEKNTPLEQQKFKISSNRNLTIEYNPSFLFIILYSSSYIGVGSFFPPNFTFFSLIINCTYLKYALVGSFY